MPEPLYDFDHLGLGEHRSTSIIEIGDVDVGYAIRGATVSSSMNDLPTARARLAPELIAGRPVDYFGGFHFTHRRGEVERSRFHGSVIQATPGPEGIQLECMTHPFMKERAVGSLAASNCSHLEITHLMTRIAGLPEEQVHIEGFDDALPLEAIEVVIPIRGIRVERPHRIGRITRLPTNEGAKLARVFEGQSGPIADFESADCCACGIRVARRMVDAEQSVLQEVETVLAWLTVRSRYGLALLPDGNPQKFQRAASLARPAVAHHIVSRGLQSGRTWIHELEGTDDTSILLDDFGTDWRIPPDHGISLQDRQALLACARAATELDQLQRIQALWEAVEYYVQGTEIPKAYAKSEIRRALKALPDDLDPKLIERIKDVVCQGVNNPSLRMRLDYTLRADGVPITEAEKTLLNELRDRRNDAVHGRPTTIPPREQVDWGVAIVARMLVYRLNRTVDATVMEQTSAAGGAKSSRASRFVVRPRPGSRQRTERA